MFAPAETVWLLGVTPTVKFVCFKSKNVNGNVLPVPVGFDRAEDVCAVFS